MLFPTAECSVCSQSDNQTNVGFLTFCRISSDYEPLAGIPAEGKSPVCLICMKYMIIILIIIIISLDKILSSYIANTSRTHACTGVRTRTRTPPHTTVAVRCFGAPNNDSVLVVRTLSDADETMADRRLIEINRRTGHPISQRFWKFFAYKKNARPN